MAYRLHEQVDESELEELTRENESEDAIRSAVGLHKAQKNNPALHWNKVVHAASGRIAGAAMWQVMEAPSRGKREAAWHPPGSDRDAASAMLNMHAEQYAELFQGPHVYLLEIFVLPQFRRQGVASMLMSVINSFADSQSLPIYLKAAESGVPLYEKHGFVARNSVHLSLDHLKENERMKEIRKAYLPYTAWPMVRPPQAIP